ncbi:MAG: hypothetical protein JST35_12400 [Armatimonadetes bacterium]|jgi:hypothetical protein|nr:hypothetical protein [Armatimonadota bacterium]
MLTLKLSVKFRAFGITFGQVDETFRALLDDSGFHISAVTTPEPPTANVLINRRGVRLSVW